MLDKVREILAEQLCIRAEEITMESRVKDDLGADSLDIMQLLMTIEDEYGITIPDDDLATFVTVSDIVVYLEELDNE